MGKWLTGWRIYTQIADQLRQRIRDGVYPPGSYLPSEAAVAAEFHVARNTARRALVALEEDKLVATILSKGRYVLHQRARSLDREYLYRSIAADVREQIQRGDLQPGARVPSETKLSHLYGASRNTTRQALAELEDEGLIVAVHVRGALSGFPQMRRPRTSSLEPGSTWGSAAYREHHEEHCMGP